MKGKLSGAFAAKKSLVTPKAVAKPVAVKPPVSSRTVTTKASDDGSASRAKEITDKPSPKKSAFGIKRPGTALAAKTSEKPMANVGTPQPKKGLKPPQEVKTGLQRPTTAATAINTAIKGATMKMIDKSAVLRNTPAKIASSTDNSLKSAETDELDDIYSFKDPVEVSLQNRKKAGAIHTVVPDKNSKQGKFFYTLSYKGDAIPISEQAKNNWKILAGAKTDSKGKIVEPEKPKDDPIDKQM